MTSFKNYYFNILPVGTTMYKMHQGKILQLTISEVSSRMNSLKENYVFYTAHTDSLRSSLNFVQPLDGKFVNAKSINGLPLVNTLFETKEECVEAFLNELGVKAEVKIKVE